MPGHVHVLPLAADAFRPPLASSFERRYLQRGSVCPRSISGNQGNILRRRYLQLPQRTHHRTLLETEEAELYVVLHVARDYRSRHPEGDEGSRVPSADRRLRIGRSAASQEHQEGRNGGYGRALYRQLQEAWPAGPRRFYRRTSRRIARKHSKDD